ncbi:MAG: bifunctional 4-hydroxy-2-oxoglutarate aldolase/2-dehydro-3-deoxy-phosphogluconate aldolase [Ruminococcaceae bacterium]|nr:bifunctional 4-hydroxy-2-oxoglutarate aldolase/2-dehydro-3-deoxy-phosphogluconate aldolase [Oscillospiraceae bacterium]
MREKVISLIEEAKIITIVRGVASDKLIPLVKAMYDGGIRLVECTYDASGKKSDEAVASDIKALADTFGDKMAIGAGTVMTEKQVELTKKAGGSFIISPDTNKEIIEKTVELGLVSIPGALTPSEVAMAHRYGADFIKVFPVDLFGSKYIKTLKAPLSNVKLLAVNGISDSNIREYLDAGASGVGVGSGIVNKDMIQSDNFEGITKLAQKYAEKIQ